MNDAATVPAHRSSTRKLLRVAATLVVLLLLLFLPAGTLAFPEAWAFLVTLAVPAVVALVHLARRDPALLERRLETKEIEPRQKLLMRIALIPMLLGLIVPGLDHRFGWSDMPLGIVAAGDACVLAGYFIFIVVIRENRWASRVIEVQSGQQVVSSGPYARVRHPMYVGSLLIYLATPVALGSWWGLLPASLIVPVIVARILNEEEVMARDLAGYRGYLLKVRWRLVPGIW